MDLECAAKMTRAEKKGDGELRAAIVGGFWYSEVLMD